MMFSLKINKHISVAACQYSINDKQQFIVIDIDFDILISEIEPMEGIEYTLMGKLADQSLIFRIQAMNSLQKDQWNFQMAPNPEIILITEVTS